MSENKPSILFISRAYPPIVGGLENQNYELSIWLSKLTRVKTIANKAGKKMLPFFLPYSLTRTLFLMRKYDVLLLGDGVLSIVGYFAKLFYPAKKIICVAHGLDLTYTNSIYQKLWVGFFIKKLDRLIAVGNETIRAGVAREIPEEKFIFIPNGVNVNKCFASHSRNELEKILGVSLSGKHVLLTSGRLAKRKGVAWFIENVMPNLPENVLYVIAGDGPDKENIKEAIKKTALEKRIIILGYVPDETRDILFNTCDIFIQPNIKLEGDMEGFGISVIEAGSCQLPVVASRLEGLQDAIQDGQNGILAEPHNADNYVEKIKALLDDDDLRKELGRRARVFIVNNYSWEIIAKRYVEEIEKIIN